MNLLFLLTIVSILLLVVWNWIYPIYVACKQKKIERLFNEIAFKHKGILVPAQDVHFCYKFPELRVKYKKAELTVGIYWSKDGGHGRGRFLYVGIPKVKEKKRMGYIVNERRANSHFFQNSELLNFQNRMDTLSQRENVYPLISETSVATVKSVYGLNFEELLLDQEYKIKL